MDAQAALGAEDYQALAGMLTSSDASTRAQGQGLAKKLTPPEQREFFDFQQQANKGKDATSQRADSNMVSVGGVGIAPEDALIAGQAARGVAGAVGSGGAVAGAKTAFGHAAGYAKFEVVKHGLVALGVPHGVADAAALIVAGRGGKAAEVETEAANPDLVRIVTRAERPNGPLTVQRPPGATYANPTGAAPASPVASPPAAPAPVVAAPAPQGEPVSPPSAPPAPAASAPSPPAPVPAGPQAAANTLPDQKALNEAALAVRRQAYQQRLQASQVAAEAPAAEAAGYVKPAPLTKEETVAFWNYIKRGMSGADAMKNVQLQRELATTLGTPTPTAAQTRFPKGMRGKQP